MNDLVKQSVHPEAENNQPSGAWIRSKFQVDPNDEIGEDSRSNTSNLEVDDRTRKATRDELDGPMNQLAAALSKTLEIPMSALQQTLSQKLHALESRVSAQHAVLDEATFEVASLKGLAARIEEYLADREKEQERTSGKLEELRARFDKLEIDLRQQVGAVSSSIEQLHSKVAIQQTEVQNLQQERDRRSEIVERVSQALETLISAVSLLGESSRTETP